MLNAVVFPRLRSSEAIPVVVIATLMLGVAAPLAGAQDRPRPQTGATSPPQEQAGLLPEPSGITRAFKFAEDKIGTGGGSKDGFYPEFGNMITGSGWISAGPGYRHHILKDRAVFSASAALSWNLYKMAQATVEFPRLANDRLTVGAQVMYQDLVRVNYFGLGNDSLRSDRSGYRLDETGVIAYATAQATPWLSVNGRFGWINTPNISTMAGRKMPYPNTLDVFSERTAPGLTQQPAFLHGDVSVVADTRNHTGHPTRGGIHRATLASYADRDSGTYSFERYEVEGAQYVPLAGDKWVVALRAWEVFSNTSTGHTVPFYLLPSLGGKNTLRGFDDYRFHDRNLQLFSAESRWALFTHVDVAVFVDAGKVGSVASDLDFKHLKKSYGAGIRAHNLTSMFGRLDFAHSAEGWRVVFKINDPFKHSTLSGGRTEVAPYVP